MARETAHSTYITLRLSRPMIERVRTVATAEGNPLSSVLRRLLARGLAAEQSQAPQESRTPEAAA